MLALLLPLLVPAALAAPGPDLPHQAFRLENGLHVILHVDRSVPLVAVDVLYDVGSKDELPGRTGLAHLFEHLMFQGTAHLPRGEADRLIEAAGGTANGGTGDDATQYWQLVPAPALEQALYLEAERMGFTLPVLDQRQLDLQREVVRNERRQTLEMQPYGAAWKVLRELLWDAPFPYRSLPIGSHEDLQAATLEDARAWSRRHYGPAHATLALAGDFDPAEARRLVERWFGGLAGSPPAPRAWPEPAPLREERRAVVPDDVQLPRLYLGWQGPRGYAAGEAELEIASDILASGKSSRLVRRLVMEERIAQSVWASMSGGRLAGEFTVIATPKPGVDPERVRAAIDEELARLGREPPAAPELRRAQARIEAGAVFGLEPLGGDGGRAALLNRYFLDTGDAGFLPRDLARYREATAEGVRAAVARWLRPGARAVVTIVPRPPPAAGEGR